MMLTMRYAVLVVVLAASVGCARADSPKPLLWKVSDADNTVYLLGSFHALKPGDYPLADSVEMALADAESVVFEVSPEQMRSAQLPAKMLAAAKLPAGSTLQQMLSEGQWHRLELYAAKNQMDINSLQQLEPWFVAVLISFSEMGNLGYEPKLGLDQTMMDKAIASGKQTAGLESGEDQIAVFDGMGRREQVQSLIEALDDANIFKEKIDKLHAQWRAGDGDGLYASMAGRFKRDYPALYQRINVDRNQAWLPRVQALIDGSHSDDALVVVGSLHLLGDDGLVTQLKRKGYRVERL